MYLCSSFLLLLMSVLFFFKQKTAYEMRISDWSSDVCSSDLTLSQVGTIVTTIISSFVDFFPDHAELHGIIARPSDSIVGTNTLDDVEIGRASCRERVCQYV